ncbi:hypothetical protein [Geodermatophilus ruber]|uniref:Integral membrane protein n=1 Tax=Geodermatophilus ruber TaxID=504800 RepID=A0A1I4E326_9ACTN|nr:hypothetical protein [Geodermatophilus ruber]SFK98591.1 hypothetical protein SAMN04488085_105128 [Geodermatophilus ruber]
MSDDRRGAGSGAPAPGPARRLPDTAGAALGALCVALHVVAALVPGSGNWLARGLLLIMAAGCLPCVRGLWLAPTARVWVMTGVMYGVMLAVHLLLMTTGSPVTGGHVHAAGPGWTEVGAWGGAALALTQLVVAVGVLVARRWALVAPSATSSG